MQVANTHLCESPALVHFCIDTSDSIWSSKHLEQYSMRAVEGWRAIHSISFIGSRATIGIMSLFHDLIAEIRDTPIKVRSFSPSSWLLMDVPDKLIKAVDDLIDLPPCDEVIMEKFSVLLMHKDLLRLKNGVWLNDEIINFFLKLLQEYHDNISCLDSAKKQNIFMNTFFYSKMVEGCCYEYKNIERWTSKFDIFSCEKVFIPVNLNNLHWSLVFVSIPTQEIQYIDSLGSAGEEILKNIKLWLRDEAYSKKGIQLADFAIKSQRCPLQHNNSDCGVFTLAFVDLLSNELPLRVMDQDIAGVVRKRIAFWIIKGRLVVLYLLISTFKEIII